LAKGPERIVLISDAMPTAAGGPDQFHLQGRMVIRSGTRLTLADGTLAGATIVLADAVRYVQEQLGVSQTAALAMATRTPTQFLASATAGTIQNGTPLATIFHWPSPTGQPQMV
jgi:N-acetylglucosamine-6-phosphate deacetylase